MTDLMEKHNYRGWYIGIVDENIYADRTKGVSEFGPFSKNRAIKSVKIFNQVFKKTKSFKDFYAVAISGREVIKGLIEQAERKAGWDPNP